jgi:hypothetical protein
VSYKHIPIEKRVYYVICRNTEEIIESQQEKREESIPGMFTFSFSMNFLQDKEQERVKKAKTFRGT